LARVEPAITTYDQKGKSMARHWSAFVSCSDKQAYALDKMAEEHDLGDGMSLLMKITGNSRSKVGQMDAISLRHAIDKAFKEYGRAKV
jgi:hypothetical protein